MSALFRSLNSFSAKRENAVKEALINTLSENSREVQYEAKQRNCDFLELCEVTNSLCTTLEAIFLHGLKDSFLWQTINVIAGDVDRRPEPSFWSPLMVFLHKQVIEQIQTLSQITTEVGQCRAWIRLSLNDSLFSSYFNNMRKNSSALSHYYKKCALIKDSDGLETAAKIMEGLEAFIQFNLSVNSSLLNQWPDYSLQLSGLWTPALKSCPISSGVDVAGSLPTEIIAIPTPQPLQTNELFSESISNSPFSRTSNFGVEDLNQRENLELFLQKVDEMDRIDEETNDAEHLKAQQINDNNTQVDKEKTRKKKSNRKHLTKLNVNVQIQNIDNNCTDATSSTSPVSPVQVSSSHGNSLTNLMQTSWSSDLNNDDTNSQNSHFNLQRSISMTSSISGTTLRSPIGDRCSYNALLKKHERNRDVDWTEVWEKFLLQNSANVMNLGAVIGNEREQDIAERDSNESFSDFEVIQNSALEKFDIVELQEMVEQLCKLAHEPGLDTQGFLCKSCQHPIGIGYSHFQVCGFSGNYFCDNCMDIETVLIPAKIIFNWDFRKYAVSKHSAAFLAEFRSQPFIDLKILNPDIYNASDAMAELQSLRIRLNFIRAYLFTCSPSSFGELQKLFFGREYLYEHIHQYSIGDLAMIQRGTLYQQLQKAYKIGESHILKCHLCSVKGFICEICQSPRVLYPFHINTTYRCEICGAVFHAHCSNNREPCPKCERIKRREENL